ncbi:MAG: hypothetical protein ACE5HX_12100, partial [bacterium]
LFNRKNQVKKNLTVEVGLIQPRPSHREQGFSPVPKHLRHCWYPPNKGISPCLQAAHFNLPYPLQTGHICPAYFCFKAIMSTISMGSLGTFLLSTRMVLAS